MTFVRTVAASCLAAMLLSPVLAEEKLGYNRDIRPILAENCFSCHGPDSASRQASLRLDRLEDAIAMRDGGAAIVPGRPELSLFFQRLISTDPEVIMPPPTSHKVLKPAEIRLLRQWIEQGAEYEPHWSLIAPKRPQVPSVAGATVRNPIDAFVAARLREERLSQNVEADRRTIARRVSLDLTGLPPTPQEVEAFVSDTNPNAYEAYVDRLLESPRWGEHRARYWLDAARYADTHGIHFDNFREMWSYREWVIKAFNRNLPFDQFTIEQLAGDLLPERTLEQQIASGFNRCNITTNEGGVIAEEYVVLYARDRTETTSQVWMGLTTGCAVCHDHKFDPVTQRDFYSLAAFFNNTTQNVMDGNIKDTPPIVVVPAEADRPRWQMIGGEIATAKQLADAEKAAARPRFEAWLSTPDQNPLGALTPPEELAFYAPLNSGSGAEMNVFVNGASRSLGIPSDGFVWKDGYVSAQAPEVSKEGATPTVADAGDLERDQPFTMSMWLKLDSPKVTGAAVSRMNDADGTYQGWDVWMENGRVGMHLINKWSEDAIKVVSKGQLKAKTWYHVAITYDGSSRGEGLSFYLNGEKQAADIPTNALKNSIRTTVPLTFGQRQVSARLPQASLQDFRIHKQALTQEQVRQESLATRASYLMSLSSEDRKANERDDLFQAWLPLKDEPWKVANAALLNLQAEEAALRNRGTIAHVMQEKAEPAMAYVLQRGDYDKRRDPVTPNTPSALPAFPDDFPKNRLGLARWLLAAEHPLTARVTVNRIWQELFGTGLVRTAGDFGVTGELPSHPELLDWLAIELRDNGWNLKQFYKLIVTSHTYRQSAAATAELASQDPANRWLARGPRFRMDAEMIRDYALAASGLLVEKIGGPSVKPYMPDGVWEAVAMIGSNTRDYRKDQGEGLYRRSLYTFWKRSAPPASMEIFNAPSREACTVRRERTNTPLQALVTLNDPQFIEAARFLAEQTVATAGTDSAGRLDAMVRRILSRPLTAEEQAIFRSSIEQLAAYYQSHEADAQALLGVGDRPAAQGMAAAELATWTLIANELLNLDESLCK